MKYDCHMCDGEILQNDADKISGCARCNKCETILSPDEFIIHQKEAELEDLQDKMCRIKTWCEAYSINIFSQPDMDAIAAGCMRHVLKEIVAIIEEK